MAVHERMMDVTDGPEGKADPLCFHYGLSKPTDNRGLFRLVVGEMAAVAERRCGEDDGVRASGFVIDTTSLDKAGILEVRESFGADVIAVIDHEKLCVFHPLHSERARRLAVVTASSSSPATNPNHIVLPIHMQVQ